MTPLEFCALHAPALRQREARHGIMLFNMTALAESQSAEIAFWSLGAPGQCAMRVPGRPIVLGDLSLAQCEALAEETAQLSYSGVVGPEQTALSFAHRATELGIRFSDPMPQRIHSLADKPRYPDASGHARQSSEADAETVHDWIGAFVREATLHDAPPTPEQSQARAAEGRFMLWIVDGEPVSMAAIVRRTPTAAAISAVYTPPQLRGRGYAGCITASVAEQIFAEGRSLVCIYTDLRNPYSNRCYAKIGFQPVCDSAFVPRVPAP